MTAETTPAITIPSRNRAGSRRRSEPGITVKRTPPLGAWSRCTATVAPTRTGEARLGPYAVGAVVRSDATL